MSSYYIKVGCVCVCLFVCVFVGSINSKTTIPISKFQCLFKSFGYELFRRRILNRNQLRWEQNIYKGMVRVRWFVKKVVSTRTTLSFRPLYQDESMVSNPGVIISWWRLPNQLLNNTRMHNVSNKFFSFMSTLQKTTVICR